MTYNGYEIINNNYENIIKDSTFVQYVIGRGKKSYAINFIPSGFDIETSTIYKKDEKGKVKQHFSFMYIWQFSFGNKIFIGRTWDDFNELINAIEKHLCKAKCKFLIFIENQDFEFQFFSKELEHRGHSIDVFARKNRKPMKIEIDNKIMFLDSYKITGLSLEKIGENYTTTKKLKGDLDYSLVRHFNTPLNDKELAYCYNDVIILKEYAEYYEKTYLQYKFIPLTQTMRANKIVKDKVKELGCKEDIYYLMRKAYPKSRKEYEYIMTFYSGAYTHGMLPNLFTTKYDGLAFDVTSEYPYVMMAKYYPMGKFRTLKKEFYDKIDNYLSKYCCLCDVTLHNIRTKHGVTILSQNKVFDVVNPVWDNGRLFKADSVRCHITEVDLATLKLHYKYEIEWHYLSYTERGYLPAYFRLAIAELYVKKDTLKGVEGKEIEYMESKQELNGQYGACCTKLEFIDLFFEDGWHSKDKEVDFDKLWEKKDKLPQWAVWITAHSRHLILSTVAKIKAEDYWYTDTDSIKCANKQYIVDMFNNINAEIKEQNMKWVVDLGLNELYPEVNFLKMGTFDREHDLIRFKSLGSKRYLAETTHGIEQTVAGLPKGVFMNYVSRETLNKKIDAFDLFTEQGLVLSEKDSRKLTAFYCDEHKVEEITDYLGEKQIVSQQSYLSLIPITFNMQITDNLIQLYTRYKQMVDDM